MTARSKRVVDVLEPPDAGRPGFSRMRSRWAATYPSVVSSTNLFSVHALASSRDR